MSALVDELILGVHGSGVRLEARVTPRASRSRVEGVRDGRLVVKVTAPPVDHAANAAVVHVIANALGLPKRAVSIVAGERSRTKTLSIASLSEADIRRRLSAILGTSRP